MRLGLRLLNVGAAVNNHKQVEQITIARGETLDVCVQLVDEDQDGLRYVPAAGATVLLQIPRSDQVIAAPLNTRQNVNNGLSRQAIAAWDGDRSCWRVSLFSSDTENMVSGSIRVTVTEGSSKKIANHTQAIRVLDGQDQ
jgi:uncharacterized cupin superfamily protein